MTNATLSLQQEIEARGLEIFARMRGEKPGVFKSVTGRMMDWSMRDPALKTQLFRFVDVLPTLSTSREIARHAGEYLDGVTGGLPAPLRLGMRICQRVPWLMALAARRGVTQLGKTFILARNGREAVPALRAMRRQRLAFTVDILGETAVSEIEAQHYQTRYLELIESLAQEAGKWPAVEQIDRDDQGEIPRVNISVKLSALYSQVHPADPETAIERISARLRPLMAAAKQRGVFINFDMESTALKDITLEVFKRLLDEPEFQDYPHAGLAFQAYLRDSEGDFETLLGWAMARRRRITIRLIKGAYWDYESVLARQRGWPSPVFENKAETDATYEKLARRMLENPRFINCAFATHNVRSAAACMVQAGRLGISRRSFEFQMLHGMAEPIKLALAGMGYRVRDYCPVGETLPGMSYLVRRLLENTSNEGFLRATYNEGVEPVELLRDPENARVESGKQKAENGRPRTEDRGQKEGGRMELFENEPLTDFRIEDNRRRMIEALRVERTEFGRKYPLVIGGRETWTEREILSINPARPGEVVGRVAKGGRDEAAAAVQAAGAAFRAWSRTGVEQRAGVLTRAAELLRQARFELAALEVFEEGKPWIEADADVAEAIDFCDFYAAQMRRISTSRYAVPGETSLHEYVPRGIAAVIAPWNFPLAILCGMTTAAIVAGNTVVMKPAEQSPVIAWRLMDILQRAGLPPGVANFLPGSGEEAGSYLVEHPDVSLIAFTGSRKVGLGIYEAAGRVRPGQKQLKHAVCEMGGKNAMIVDEDADVDEAAPAIVYSAFGYQGQKCSALSRLIVLKDNYDRVLDRVIEACRDLQAGPPEEPGTVVGPVIDKAAYDSILRFIEVGKQEGKLAFQGRVPAGEGYFIPPTIFTDVSPAARIAREEIFGPVLCVFKARDMDEALAWANGTEYALTGGLFSRSPGNITRVKAELEAGNVYINRSITGAMVARHPFGGFKMSGGGTKAGGRDYLLHFLLPRVVTENDMRRGFVPEEAGPQ
jgi:RHH-type transcriptional regulator, proline utilization regulon repressor / proline dehydrogenase / delta 1-pyrroline-5-carboxylate dehydrogenase